jgi:3-phenylpropionate/trans-cinnamate dioxygenase ferredoxin subunit
VIGRVDDLPPGSRQIVSIEGRSIGVFNVDGTYYALRNSCPHQGGPLCTGDVLSWVTSEQPGEYVFDPERKLLACPWHNWEFDMATGQSWFDPARTRVHPYEVVVESGREIHRAGAEDDSTARVRGPYVAETLQVQVEDDYVVVLP